MRMKIRDSFGKDQILYIIMAARLIDMSRQTCNYCKALGHRIHAMDPYGTYLCSETGERILACPVLIGKQLADFPPLANSVLTPEAASWTASVTTKISSSISVAVKERKEKEHAAWLQQKEEKKMHREQRHSHKMQNKYGPRWHWIVEKTEEDCETADQLRCHDEKEADRIIEQMELRSELREEEAEKRLAEREAARQARRATMTKEELEEDNAQEMDEMSDWLDSHSGDWYNSFRIRQEGELREKALYEKNGWVWHKGC